MEPIGYVENEFSEPVYDEDVYDSVSKIVICEEFSDGLYKIQEFDRLQVLFYFSRSKDYELIQRRSHDGQMAGVFATRSPKRPNSIGLTTVMLMDVEDNTLYVKGLDAINGTPVLDIKPCLREYDKEKD